MRGFGNQVTMVVRNSQCLKLASARCFRSKACRHNRGKIRTNGRKRFSLKMKLNKATVKEKRKTSHKKTLTLYYKSCAL